MSRTVGDVLQKIAVKDAVYSVSLLALAYHAYLAYATIKETAHEHLESSAKDGYAGNPGALTETVAIDTPFGFSVPGDTLA
jgi:hypothetical protein